MTTTIDGYEVELETTHDGFVAGWVKKGNYSASVEALRIFGFLDGASDSLAVPVKTRRKIYDWAISNGY